MKRPSAKTLKLIWWLIVLGIVSYFVNLRYPSLISGTNITSDIIIFIVWVALLLYPLFYEIDILGLKFKREIEDFKNDMKEQILNLRTEIQNHVVISPQFNIGQPPTDAQIKSMEPKIKKSLEEVSETQKIKGKEEISKLRSSITPDAQFLIAVRIKIEKEIRRIYEKEGLIKERNKFFSIIHIVQELGVQEILDPRLVNIVIQVWRICTPAVHGEDITKTQMDFVKQYAPLVIVGLESL